MPWVSRAELQRRDDERRDAWVAAVEAGRLAGAQQVLDALRIGPYCTAHNFVPHSGARKFFEDRALVRESNRAVTELEAARTRLREAGMK